MQQWEREDKQINISFIAVIIEVIIVMLAAGMGNIYILLFILPVIIVAYYKIKKLN